MDLDRWRRGVTDLATGRPQGLAFGVVTIVTCSAVYGAALGAWNSGRLAAFAAVKLPLVLLVTAGLTLLFNAAAAVAFGARAGVRDVVRVTVSAMAVASLLLASLAPVILLFDLSLPPAGTGSRTTHNLLYLVHTGAVGISGLVGAAVLWRSLRSSTATRGRAVRILCVWLLSLAVVGGEVAWAMRPFVGSIYLEVVFLREDALDGNVYEFIWTDIRPHLLGRNGSREGGER